MEAGRAATAEGGDEWEGKQKALRKNEKWKQFAKASSAWL